jgi:hypothetical protein
MSDKSLKKPKLTVTQAKVVKAKIKAELTDTPIGKLAQEVFPNATPESARVMVHQNLQNITVQQALQEALAKYDLTTDRLANVVDEAMSATKTVIIGKDEQAFADEVPDHGIRLKAAGMAANWMGIGKGQEGGTTNFNFVNVSKTDQNDYSL